MLRINCPMTRVSVDFDTTFVTMIKTIYLGCLMALAHLSFGQTFISDHILSADSSQYNMTQTVDDLSWMAGSWLGTGFGGRVEEIWSAPINGHMVGLCRYDMDGELVFTEHCTISDTPGGVRFRIKHFSADFKGWESSEEYIDFPLIKIEGQTAYFNGATVARTEDTLRMYVWIELDDGSASEQLFEYQRR